MREAQPLYATLSTFEKPFMNQHTTPSTPAAHSGDDFLSPETFDELDAILDELRTRYDETPQWEFCEGFMAALICGRREVPAAEYFPVLLGLGEDGSVAATDASTSEEDAEGSFASDEQRERFTALWDARWAEVSTALDAECKTLEDDDCYHPEVMDVRAAVAELPAEEQVNFKADELPAFAQVWALGFMFAVESWPEDWATPRDKDAAKWLDGALEAVVAMTEDDTGTPEVSPLMEEGLPSTSIARLNAFGEAIWAVYDLHELWRTLGPRVDTVRKEVTPGRNDVCFCGSGKKYKKCHGAT
jgi:uncharacterized protein